MKITAVLSLVMLLTACYVHESELIPYEILHEKEHGYLKYTMDIQVNLVDDRLPTKDELEDIAEFRYWLIEGNYRRTFIAFYLPGMSIGAGNEYAKADLYKNDSGLLENVVHIVKYNLAEYSQYHRFVDKEDIELAKKLGDIK